MSSAADLAFYASRPKPAPRSKLATSSSTPSSSVQPAPLNIKRGTKEELRKRAQADYKKAGVEARKQGATASDIAKAVAAEEHAKSVAATHQALTPTAKRRQAQLSKREFEPLLSTGISIGPAPIELTRAPFAVRVTHTSGQLGGRLHGTLEDPAMNPSDYDDASPATRGYIQFPVSIVNPIHLRTVIGILKVICKSCFTLLVEGPELEQVMAAPPSSRLSMLEALLEKQGESTVCPVERESGPKAPPHPMVEYKIKKSLSELTVYYTTKKPKGRAKTKKDAEEVIAAAKAKVKGGAARKGRPPKAKAAPAASAGKGKCAGPVEIMSTHMIQTIFENISGETATVLGFTRESIRAMIIPGIIVPPLEVRPTKSFKGSKPALDEITKGYASVLTASKALADAKWAQDAGEGQNNVAEKTIQLSAAVAKLFQWILTIFSGKEGLGRSDIIGKRLNLSARGVIGPGDEYLESGWLGVPEFLTNTNGRLETVTPQNITMIRELLKLGQVVKIRHHETGYLRTVTPEMVERNSVRISVGDEVHRKLMHGDYVIDMRAPTIHRHSVGAHRVRVVKHNAFMVPLVHTPLNNADYDGDEYTVVTPTSDEALYEAETYLSFKANMMSSQSGKPATGLVQNSILYSMLLTQDPAKVELSYIEDAAKILVEAGGEMRDLGELERRVKRVKVDWPSAHALFSLPFPAGLDYAGDNFRLKNGILVEGCYNRADLEGESANFVTDLLGHYTPALVDQIRMQAIALLDAWGLYAPPSLKPWDFGDAIATLSSWKWQPPPPEAETEGGYYPLVPLSKEERQAKAEDYNRRIQESGIPSLSLRAYLSLALPADLNWSKLGGHTQIVNGILVKGKIPDPLTGDLIRPYPKWRVVQLNQELDSLRKHWAHKGWQARSVRVPMEIFQDCLELLTERAQLASFNYRVRNQGIPPLSGKALFSSMLPEDFEYSKGDVEIIQGVLVRGTITKADVGPNAGAGILHKLIIDYPGERGLELGSRFLTDANRLLNYWGRYNTHSVGLDAVATVFDPWVEEQRVQLYRKLEEAALDPNLTDSQILALSDASKKLGPQVAVYEKLRRAKAGLTPNALWTMVLSGAKGSLVNVYAIHTPQGIMTNSKGLLPHVMSDGQRIISSFRPGETSLASKGFVAESYGLGLGPNSAFIAAAAGRETLITDIAPIGNLHRQANLATQDISYVGGRIMDVSSGMVYQFGPFGGDGFDVARTIKIGGVALPFDPAALARRINALGGWFPIPGGSGAELYQQELEEEEEEVPVKLQPYQSDFTIPPNERLFTDIHGVKHRLIYPVYGDSETAAKLVTLGREAGSQSSGLVFPVADPEASLMGVDLVETTVLVEGEEIDI